jgi:glucosamine 6-phosphate synthetase-like amidotransferase/phosphosugar isomerase protein
LILIFRTSNEFGQIEKRGYDFMLKEIYEQPNVIKDTYRGDYMLMKELFKWQVLRIIGKNS